VESHGENSQKEVIVIIPARFSSERLPGKLLLEAGGKPLIVHTLERATKARSVSRVLVAVDDQQLFDAVTDAGGEAVMTSTGHTSGSDRIAEVAERLFGSNSIIVNVQGDEPQISPATIDAAVEALVADRTCDIATVCEPISEPEDVLSPDVVKVVMDVHGRALYFSRSPIPFPRDTVREYGDLGSALREEPGLLGSFRKHSGLYVFRHEALMRFTSMTLTPLERAEKLEQLRALENGLTIRVVETAGRSVGIDTEDDLVRFRQSLEGAAA